MKFNEFYSLAIVHSRDIILVKGVDYMNITKQKSQKTFDKQAADYDTNIQGEHARKLYKPIIENLKNKNIHSILDLGCGTGALLKEIKELNIAEQLFGIDISPNMLEIAKNKLGNDATLILGDSERLPFEDSSFDAIVCNDSFHHYPQPDIVEKEVSRCLKQNGVFIIGDCWQPIGARQIMNYYMKHSNSGDVKIYSKKEMLLLLSKDFHEIEWKSFGTRSCLIIAYNN